MDVNQIVYAEAGLLFTCSIHSFVSLSSFEKVIFAWNIDFMM